MSHIGMNGFDVQDDQRNRGKYAVNRSLVEYSQGAAIPSELRNWIQNYFKFVTISDSRDSYRLQVFHPQPHDNAKNDK